MFLKRKKISSNYKTVIANVDFADKKNTNAIVEEISKNATVEKGALRSVRDIELYNSFTGTNVAYECGMGLIMCTKYSTYFRKTEDIYLFLGNYVYKKPAFTYSAKQQRIMISEPNVGTYYYTPKSYSMISENGYDTLAQCKERVFAVEGSKLLFTERADATKWNGYVTLPQEAVAVTEYGDDLLVVGHEIFKVEFSDRLEKTKVTCLYEGLRSVYPQSVLVVEGKLIFLTDDGLFCFYQNKVTRLCEDVSFAKDNSDAMATRFEGYWLAYTDGQNKRQLLHLKTDGTYIIYDIDVTHVAGSDGKIYMVVDEKPRIFSDAPAKLYWKSKEYGFGNEFEKKHLRNLYVDTLNAVDIHVVTENERRIFHVDGGSHKIPLKGTFGRVSLEIHATEETRVEKVALEAQCYGQEVTHGYNN